MDTTTDRIDDRPAARRRPPRSRRTRTRPHRDRPVLGVAVSVAALSAVTGFAALASHGADRDDPVRGVVGRPGTTTVADGPTELDVHGIPTWWSGAGAAG